MQSIGAESALEVPYMSILKTSIWLLCRNHALIYVQRSYFQRELSDGLYLQACYRRNNNLVSEEER